MEDTLVIFSSDNGGLMASASSNAQRGAAYGDGEAPATPEVEHQANGTIFRGDKSDNWERGHRGPFLARWPGKIKAGTQSEETISMTEMLATFAALAEQDLADDDGPDSFNVLPALLERELDDSLRRPRVMQSGGISGMSSFREGLWKLIDGQGGGRYRDGKAEPGEPRQLYDLSQDLREEADVYSQHPDLAKRPRQLLYKIKAEGRRRRSMVRSRRLSAGDDQ